MSTDLDIRIVIDDQATIVGIASIDEATGTVTLTDPAFIMPDPQTGKASFIPVLLAMGISHEEEQIVIPQEKLKFGKAFKASDEIANAYKKDFGYAVIEVPEEKKLILQ